MEKKSMKWCKFSHTRDPLATDPILCPGKDIPPWKTPGNPKEIFNMPKHSSCHTNSKTDYKGLHGVNYKFLSHLPWVLFTCCYSHYVFFIKFIPILSQIPQQPMFSPHIPSGSSSQSMKHPLHSRTTTIITCCQVGKTVPVWRKWAPLLEFSFLTTLLHWLYILFDYLLGEVEAMFVSSTPQIF